MMANVEEKKPLKRCFPQFREGNGKLNFQNRMVAGAKMELHTQIWLMCHKTTTTNPAFGIVTLSLKSFITQGKLILPKHQ